MIQDTLGGQDAVDPLCKLREFDESVIDLSSNMDLVIIDQMLVFFDTISGYNSLATQCRSANLLLKL